MTSEWGTVFKTKKGVNGFVTTVLEPDLICLLNLKLYCILKLPLQNANIIGIYSALLISFPFIWQILAKKHSRSNWYWVYAIFIHQTVKQMWVHCLQEISHYNITISWTKKILAHQMKMHFIALVTVLICLSWQKKRICQVSLRWLHIYLSINSSL